MDCPNKNPQTGRMDPPGETKAIVLETVVEAGLNSQDLLIVKVSLITG
jgi:hypothetical protein